MCLSAESRQFRVRIAGWFKFTNAPTFPYRGLRPRSRSRAAAAPGRRRGPTGSLGRRGGACGPAAGRARSRSGDVGRRRREEAVAPSRSRCPGSAAGTARAAAEGREGQGQPHGALPAAGGSGGGPVGCSGWTPPPAAPSGRRTPRLPASPGWVLRSAPRTAGALRTSRAAAPGHHRRPRLAHVRPRLQAPWGEGGGGCLREKARGVPAGIPD